MPRHTRKLGLWKFKRRGGHRSHISGVRRWLAGPMKSARQDALHADAKAIMRTIMRRLSP